jgi:hypothetical protein
VSETIRATLKVKSLTLAPYIPPEIEPPAAPSALSATMASAYQIDLSWTDNSTDESGFEVQRSPDGSSGWATVGYTAAGDTTYSDLGLNPGTTYYYRVRAYSDAGSSAWSNTANATTDALPAGDAWYASPGGSGTVGSLAQPFALDYALGATSPIGPGDTLYLLDGHYGSHTRYDVYISGTEAEPVTIRPNTGAVVDIDGALRIYGSHLVVTNAKGADFRIHQHWTTRYLDHDLTGHYNLVQTFGTNVKIVNLVLHDGYQGVVSQTDARRTYAYGNLIYNVGVQDSDRGHGQGHYFQNLYSAEWKEIANTISVLNFDRGLQVYGTSATTYNHRVSGLLSNNILTLHGGADPGNTTHEVLNSMLYNKEGLSPDGRSVRANWKVEDNVFWTWGGLSNNIPGAYAGSVRRNAWYSPGAYIMWTVRLPSGDEFRLDWDENTYRIAATTNMFAVYTPDGSTYTRYSFAGWKSLTGYDAASTLTNASIPATVKVLPNAFEAGRAHVGIFNPSEAATVAVDLSGIGLTNGETVKVYSAFNYLGDSPYTFTYQSGTPAQSTAVPIPMTGWSWSRPEAGSDAERAADALATGWPDSWATQNPDGRVKVGYFIVRGGAP